MTEDHFDRPLCFVLMPTGVHRDSSATPIDFDRVYAEVLEPAVRRAGMIPIRSDEADLGGPTHRAVSEQLILCDCVLADLTCAGSEVLYELGVRTGFGRSTLVVYAAGSGPSQQATALPSIAYSSAPGVPEELESDIERISAGLKACSGDVPDGSAVRFVSSVGAPPVSHLKTDLFRTHVEYSETVKSDLARAREIGTVAAVDRVRAGLGEAATLEVGPAIDLLLSYRAVRAWESMIEVIDRLAAPLARSVMVREQRGLALNRLGRGEEAEQVLKSVIAEHGPSSETYALLGRVYKDRWDRAVRSREDGDAPLRQAIDAYRTGFEADWRDAYPGVNAVTLMELAEPPDPDRELLLPVVRYSVLSRLSGEPNYWDHATLLELAVLGHQWSRARRHLADAIDAIEESWQPETTANNLELIEKARKGRGEDAGSLGEILGELRLRANP